MKMMTCPLNGPRNISEFAYGGEVIPEPASDTVDDAGWASFVFLSDNSAGVVREWWCHVPTSYWFIAERHRRSNEILRTYPASEVFGAGAQAKDQPA
ncbi:MAG: sarcosine oxidase subunit delta [Rhodospirillaceae bacterium]|nr:sarcosine oxidase subunit delta [Rhodospirillaceae bacterium]|tara:strand:+ start:589 stop:879 length:291 start_codon:yes stop_codon:yes gene_type:complete